MLYRLRALRALGVTCGLSRLVLAHESRQAPSSVKRARYANTPTVLNRILLVGAVIWMATLRGEWMTGPFRTLVGSQGCGPTF